MMLFISLRSQVLMAVTGVVLVAALCVAVLILRNRHVRTLRCRLLNTV